MKTIDDLSGYDKAAIIFDILGDSLATNMFTEIPEPEFYKLRNHAKKLKNLIPTNVKKEVLEDYYFKMLSGDKYRDESVSDKMFAFLETLNEEQLFALLSRETPKIIALALEQLDNEKRMAFLSKVDPGLQNKIVIQTGNLNNIALEAIISTAKELKKKVSFLPGPVEFSRGGGKSVSDMLSKMPEDDAKQYLESYQPTLNFIITLFRVFNILLHFLHFITAELITPRHLSKNYRYL